MGWDTGVGGGGCNLRPSYEPNGVSVKVRRDLPRRGCVRGFASGLEVDVDGPLENGLLGLPRCSAPSPSLEIFSSGRTSGTRSPRHTFVLDPTPTGSCHVTVSRPSYRLRLGFPTTCADRRRDGPETRLGVRARR